MNDVESRLTEALGAASAAAPEPVGLADAARRRLRRRRRTTGVVATVAAVAAVAVSLPLLGALSGDDARKGSGPDVATDVPAPDVAAGWRVETWRDLTVQVPDSWGYGAIDQWCVGEDLDSSPSPEGKAVVNRPETVQTLVGCHPQVGYGLDFFDPASETPDVLGAKPGEATRFDPPDTEEGMLYPPGAWVGSQQTDNAGVLVVAPDKRTAMQILASTTTVTALDPLGCPAQWDGSAVVSPSTERISVCRYGGDGWLQQSDLLTEEQSATALSEIGRGPLDDGAVGCAGTEDTTIALGSLGVVTLTSQCKEGNRLVLSGTIHELTERDVYWALSPGWSGGWRDNWVPMPDELRD